MAATNRATVRKALAGLLSTELTGAGKPAQAVYDYKVGDFEGQSPVVLVTSAGSGRKHASYTTAYQNEFNLLVQVWVLYADPGAGWSEADAEDCIDLLEKSIAEVLAGHKSYAGPPGWFSIDYNGPSQIIEGNLGGSDYLIELIPVKVEVEDT